MEREKIKFGLLIEKTEKYIGCNFRVFLVENVNPWDIEGNVWLSKATTEIEEKRESARRRKLGEKGSPCVRKKGKTSLIKMHQLMLSLSLSVFFCQAQNWAGVLQGWFGSGCYHWQSPYVTLKGKFDSINLKHAFPLWNYPKEYELNAKRNNIKD